MRLAVSTANLHSARDLDFLNSRIVVGKHQDDYHGQFWGERALYLIVKEARSES